MKTLRTIHVFLFCCIFVAPLPMFGHTVQVRGKVLSLDGKPFIVKGMHYGPWRPGTGPAKGYPYPSPQNVEEDFRIIRSLNVNTILVFDPPGYVLDLADRYGLTVLYSFNINWWPQSPEASAAERDRVLLTVRDYRDKPAILGWVLGNEIPPNAIEQRGRGAIENGLADLYRAVKAEDPSHPITHSNWPPEKDLNLNFFDIVSFNLYPLWPPEVVALGYENYIENVLQPIAGNKPLLITEFGANSLEATDQGEARLIGQSWQGLRKAGACGGIVFEFADEWWKNYDNPRHAGNWWDRVPAPDDEKTHDLDPEEYYGVVGADRTPKLAFKTVQEMFASNEGQIFTAFRVIPGILILLLLLLAFGAWLWARRSHAARNRQLNSSSKQLR